VYLAGDYDVSNHDVHVLAGAVKLFFRELSEPLIPVNLLDQFVAVCRTYNCNCNICSIVSLHDGVSKVLIDNHECPVRVIAQELCTSYVSVYVHINDCGLRFSRPKRNNMCTVRRTISDQITS